MRVIPSNSYAAGYPFALFAISANFLAFQLPAQADMTAKVVSIGDGDTLIVQQNNRKVTIWLTVLMQGLRNSHDIKRMNDGKEPMNR